MARPRKLRDRKSYGPRRRLQRAEQVRVQAASRFAESSRRQLGSVHSVSSNWTSCNAKKMAHSMALAVSSRTVEGNKFASWCRYCRFHRNQVKWVGHPQLKECRNKPQSITKDVPLPTAAFLVASHFCKVSHCQALLQIIAQGNACFGFNPILPI